MVGMQGCGVFELIDDDLSVCGTDFEMVVRMQLQTNLDLELQTVLYAETDLQTRTILHDYFSHIFTDHAHDISIGFYDTTKDELVYSINEVIDANQSTYTFFLPKDEYHAIALANLKNNGIATLVDTLSSRQVRLTTPVQDTLLTQQTGLFATQREISVIDTADQCIDLTLHMVTSALALVIDTTGVTVHGITACMGPTVNSMMLRDSLFLYDHPKIIRMETIDPNISASAPMAKRAQVEEESYHMALLGSASFPSAETPDANDVYYEAKVYVSMTDGTITETVLSVHEPLRAGQLKVLRLQLQPDGEVVPIEAPEVGASVTLDWKNGGEHNIEI